MDSNSRRELATPMDDDFDPQHFIKKVDTELDFDSDGEPEFIPKGKDQFSTFRGDDGSLVRQSELSESRNMPLEASFPPEEAFFNRENKINFQYQDVSLKPAQSNDPKFTGIYEDDYFMFVEDYDNFIGEFVSNEKVKIVRGFLNHNEFNRIYYTRMSPTDKTCANLLMVHGFGHTVKYLDVK